ncbi:MAG: competence damage-inducible protein A [Candidatus Heimdallarchaeota archaeon]|nr:competence damage-inducible protein A [Candidatus Heimdallarchaeota archaeon]MCK4290635.1 competence damage-inducible protein A [Candidatus Heimdallarchaeota archaeon]
MITVEIICFGNELLIGKTVNTNANWLGKRISTLGGLVSRITTIADNLKEMEQAIREGVNRQPDIIITSGGLGPTFDDVALEAVALAADKKLELNPDALELIKQRILNLKKQRDIELHLSKERKRMAMLPEGAIPLQNREGSAPGVLLKIENTKVFSLPGVPREMKSIFDFEMIKYFSSENNQHLYERSIIVNHIPESELAASISPVREKYPSVYIKTHPRSYSTADTRIIEVEIHATTNCTQEEEKILVQVEEELIKIIKSMRGVKGKKPKITIITE